MKGSCLCQSVQYEVTELCTPILHCACQTCRKAHSAAFNTAAGVKSDAFKWMKGEEVVKFYESSPGKKRFFCGNCGTQLLAKKEGAPHWVLRLGSLDDDPGSEPTGKIWASHEVSWMSCTDGLPRYDDWMPSKS